MNISRNKGFFKGVRFYTKKKRLTVKIGETLIKRTKINFMPGGAVFASSGEVWREREGGGANMPLHPAEDVQKERDVNTIKMQKVCKALRDKKENPRSRWIAS